MTRTPKYIEEDFSDLGRDFTIWKRFNDDGRRLFDRIMTVTWEVVSKFVEDSDARPIDMDNRDV